MSEETIIALAVIVALPVTLALVVVGVIAVVGRARVDVDARARHLQIDSKPGHTHKLDAPRDDDCA